VCGMCMVYVWLIYVGGGGVVVSPQGGGRWENAFRPIHIWALPRGCSGSYYPGEGGGGRGVAC